MRNRPMLTADDTAKMMAAAKAECAKRGWANMSIAIVDDAGYLLAFERQDGAGPTTADVAIGKARAAALTRQPTKALEERVRDRPVFISYPYPNSLLIRGGLPVMVGSDGVGGVGCSGRPSEEDEAIAQAAIDALR